LDGVSDKPYDAKKSNSSIEHILGMADAIKKYPSEGGPEVMKMDYYWHPKMNWYGPSGIGSGRGVEGFRNWHQIPFINAMPDRGKYVKDITYHFFGDGDYVAVTGWPNMKQTLTHDGWMGIAPVNKKIEMRSLDFWRLENGKIRENWVMLDILDIYDQVGVNVLDRLKEFNKAKNMKGY
jgi:predicted ester cyclase